MSERAALPEMAVVLGIVAGVALGTSAWRACHMNTPAQAASQGAAPARRCYGCNRPVGARHEIECSFSEPGDVVQTYDCVEEGW